AGRLLSHGAQLRPVLSGDSVARRRESGTGEGDVLEWRPRDQHGDAAAAAVARQEDRGAGGRSCADIAQRTVAGRIVEFFRKRLHAGRLTERLFAGLFTTARLFAKRFAAQ